MPVTGSSRIGKRGTFVIPAALRRRFGLAEGSEVIAEETQEGILIRPAVTIALEIYSPERKAEFLLRRTMPEPGKRWLALGWIRIQSPTLSPEDVLPWVAYSSMRMSSFLRPIAPPQVWPGCGNSRGWPWSPPALLFKRPSGTWRIRGKKPGWKNSLGSWRLVRR
jgi:AbrB family looped-hinge helix DNA binding protein